VRDENWGILALQLTLVLITAPFVIKMIVSPVETMEKWGNITGYYDDPDYFTINGTIVNVEYIESGNWPLICKTTEIQLDSGHIILETGWEKGLILQEEYSFGYQISYEGEYSLDNPTYINHIRNINESKEKTQ